MTWNTGCNVVANDTVGGVFIVDGENEGYTLLVPQYRMGNFKGVIFPWCVNDTEIQRKAFRVYQ